MAATTRPEILGIDIRHVAYCDACRFISKPTSEVSALSQMYAHNREHHPTLLDTLVAASAKAQEGHRLAVDAGRLDVAAEMFRAGGIIAAAIAMATCSKVTS